MSQTHDRTVAFHAQHSRTPGVPSRAATSPAGDANKGTSGP